MYREKEMYDYCGQLAENSSITQDQFMMLARKFDKVMKSDHHVKVVLLEIFHMWEINKSLTYIEITPKKCIPYKHNVTRPEEDVLYEYTRKEINENE